MDRPHWQSKRKSSPHAVRRLYLAIVSRAIRDVLENGQESREAKRWLLSRDFDSCKRRSTNLRIFSLRRAHGSLTRLPLTGQPCTRVDS